MDIVELEILSEEKSKKITETKNLNKKKTISLKDILTNYSWSKDFGKPYTFTQEGYNQFILTTVKNVTLKEIMLDIWQFLKMQMILSLQLMKEKLLY